MSTTEDRNARTIEEFRSNHGQVGGYFAGARASLFGQAYGRVFDAELTPDQWHTFTPPPSRSPARASPCCGVRSAADSPEQALRKPLMVANSASE